MGSNLSHTIAETQESGGTDLVYEGNERIKKKEMRFLVEQLCINLPKLHSITLQNCKLKVIIH